MPRRTSARPVSRAASAYAGLAPGLEPQKTQILLNFIRLLARVLLRLERVLHALRELREESVAGLLLDVADGRGVLLPGVAAYAVRVRHVHGDDARVLVGL